MDLARSILLEIEAHEGPNAPSSIEIEGYTKEEVNYHLGLLYNAGFIDAHEMNMARGTRYIAKNLTWEGHEFLDAARNETVWNNTKEAAKQYGGSIPLELIKGLLMKAASSYLGLG